MSLHVPNKEIHHNTVVAETKAKVESVVQNLINVVDKKRALEVLDGMIDQLSNFRRHYAGTFEQEQSQQTQPRRDQRQQRSQ